MSDPHASDLPELPDLPDAAELKPGAGDVPALPDDAEAAPREAPAAPEPSPAKREGSAQPAAAPKPSPAAEPAAKPAAAPAAKPAAKSPAKSPAKPVAGRGTPAGQRGGAAAAKPSGAAGSSPRPRPAQKVARPARKQEREPRPEAEPAAGPAAGAAAAAGAPAEAALEAIGELPAAPPPTGAPESSDKAPEHLKKAAWIVIAGSIVPWMSHGGGVPTSIAAKLVIALWAYLLYATVVHRTGGQVPGFVAKLASVRFVKDSGKRKKPVWESVLLAVPTPVHVLAWVFLGVGLFLPSLELSDEWLLKGMAELGMLAWAAGTVVHIFAYEKGGKFNPIFPLMFLGMAVAGVIAAIGVVTMPEAARPSGALWLAMLVGALVVTGGGVFACYTMVEALKEAKRHGEEKKARARAERQAARAARRGSAGKAGGASS